MPLDFKVSQLEYKELAANAQHLRMLGGIQSNQKNFDIVDFLHNAVIPSLRKMGKNFTLEIDNLMENSAEVDLKNRVLYLADWVLTAAKSGHMRARLIVAHEIGHMVLHKDQVMAFSEDKAVQLNFLENEESAEWQAQHFALLLLLPDEVVIETRNMDANAASIVTLLESNLIAARRRDFEFHNRIFLSCFADSVCLCGRSAAVKVGASLVCQSCGTFA